MEKTKTLMFLVAGVLFCLALLSSGCIENRYTYKFNLDGSCDFTAELRGDSADIYGLAGTYPEAPAYKTRNWAEYDSSGKETYILEAKAKFPRNGIPATMGSLTGARAEFLPQHPVKLSISRLFFLSIFKYEQDFKSRNRTTIEGDRWKFIPAECKVLESGGDSLLSPAERSDLEKKYAVGMVQWNTNRYRLRFDQLLDRLAKEHPDLALPQDRRQELTAKLAALIDDHSRLQQALTPNGNLDTINLEWWDDLAPQANVLLDQYLNPSYDATRQQQIASAEDLLEFRHKLDEDLADESYTIRVDLPGRVMRSTTKVIDKGVLTWKVLGQDMNDEDVVLQASSIYLHPFSITGTVLGLMILIIVIRSRGVKMHRRSMTGPPPPRKS